MKTKKLTSLKQTRIRALILFAFENKSRESALCTHARDMRMMSDFVTYLIVLSLNIIQWISRNLFYLIIYLIIFLIVLVRWMAKNKIRAAEVECKMCREKNINYEKICRKLFLYRLQMLSSMNASIV